MMSCTQQAVAYLPSTGLFLTLGKKGHSTRSEQEKELSIKNEEEKIDITVTSKDGDYYELYIGSYLFSCGNLGEAIC